MPRASAPIACILVEDTIITYTPDVAIVAILLVGDWIASGCGWALVGNRDIQIQVAFMGEIARQFDLLLCAVAHRDGDRSMSAVHIHLLIHCHPPFPVCQFLEFRFHRRVSYAVRIARSGRADG